MPIYTFYPYTSEGAALMFEALQLDDDDAAQAHAEQLLDQHVSAAEVVVWDEDRRVHRELRGRIAAPHAADGRSDAAR